MSILFTPTRLGTLDVANRFVRSATGEGMCEADGAVTAALVDVYRALAVGGTGLIVTGHSFVRADGKAGAGMTGVHSDAMLPGLSALVGAVHETSAKVVCQLNHAGRQTQPEAIGGATPVAPSAVTNPANCVTPRELEAEEIEPLIEAYVDAAERCRRAGFDGVQLHCAHGYLMSEFISPHTNRRDDEWGGSVAARARFPLEVLRRIRSRLGREFPVLVKLNAEDFIAGGLILEESCAIGGLLEAEGIDAIEISAGMAETVERIMRKDITTEEQEAYFLPYARAFRQHVSVPLLCVAGLRSLAVMEQVVEGGAADMVSLCRPLIREPDLPAKFAAGSSRRATCISCNQCVRGPGKRLGCALDQTVA
ncbi:MAG: NADH:flavin oxidoreductase [Candidatus Brocadiae bacterium]|nr:NADH:flavin oxidoreductase [Candidatus Brocadiia bacterium]